MEGEVTGQEDDLRKLALEWVLFDGEGYEPVFSHRHEGATNEWTSKGVNLEVKSSLASSGKVKIEMA